MGGNPGQLEVDDAEERIWIACSRTDVDGEEDRSHSTSLEGYVFRCARLMTVP